MLEDGSWILDGRLPVIDFKELLKLKELSFDEQDQYDTLAGFVITRLGRIPKERESFEWKGFRFEILKMDRNRLDKVLVAPVSNAAEVEPTLT